MAATGVRTIVRYGRGVRYVTFEDDRLAASVERLQAEDPPRTAWLNLDAPPGTYEVESRTTMPGGCWEVRLDPERGIHIGNHNCPRRAENPRDHYPCIHIAAAWLLWKRQRDATDPYLRRVAAFQENDMSEPSTALAPYQGAQITTYHVPTREEISDTLALGKVLMETRGAAIPKALDTPQKAAAVILAGRELGFDPMASFRHFFIVDGQTQPDGQALTALMQRGGADIIYHCDCDECADVELRRPGREPVRVKYTMAQAVNAGSTTTNDWQNGKVVGKKTKPAWANHPADMLLWKAIARLARRGAADLVNAVQSATVRIEDYEDASRQLAPEDVHEAVYREEPRPALTDGGSGEAVANAGGMVEDQAEPSEVQPPPDEEGTPGSAAEAATASPEPDSWRSVLYADAMANKGQYFQELSAFQKELGRRAKPDGYEDLTLGEIVGGAAA